MVPHENLNILAGMNQKEMLLLNITVAKSLHALNCRRFSCPRCRIINRAVATYRQLLSDSTISPRSQPPEDEGKEPKP